MKLVTAIIKPFKLDDVKSALQGVGVAGLSVTELKGMGRQGGHTETYRGSEYSVALLPKLRVEVLVDDVVAPDVVEAILDSASTGSIGDGKVWVTTVDEVIRVRTRERDADAI